jgi:hypothetical protein
MRPEPLSMKIKSYFARTVEDAMAMAPGTEAGSHARE